MSTYWGLLENVPGSKLRLTNYDDEILAHFQRDFPDFDLNGTIDEDEMKSKEGKARWRAFCDAYSGDKEKGGREDLKVEDYNFGTMLRANPAWEYGEKETIFGEYMHV